MELEFEELFELEFDELFELEFEELFELELELDEELPETPTEPLSVNHRIEFCTCTIPDASASTGAGIFGTPP